MMKNLIFLYGDECGHSFDKVFDSQCAFERVLDWAEKFECPVYIAVTPETESSVNEFVTFRPKMTVKMINREHWTSKKLIEEMSAACEDAESETAVFTSIDKPFLDKKLTDKILEYQEKYIAEYTFADGYPEGFAPVAVNNGTLKILSSLAEDNIPVSDDCIFDVMKKDINSFEIESVIASDDYRMLRFNFSCTKKRNMLQCKDLFNLAKEKNIVFDAESLSELASGECQLHHTLPAFYNVQLSKEYNALAVYNPYARIDSSEFKDMSLGQFTSLVDEIAEFSEDAVISLSAWGEPLCIENIEDYIASAVSHKNISVLLETNGILLSEELAKKISEISRDVIWIVTVDAMTEKMYSEIWGTSGNFSACVSSVSLLKKYFNKVYPQFVRMNENESELEAFYRFWSAKDSPSGGDLIIQKYDHFCGILEDRKSADLSPIERNVCWHIKRDMTILCNGKVPLCREELDSNIIGNVFEESLEEIWNRYSVHIENHIGKKYSKKCRMCDEYYTFNF